MERKPMLADQLGRFIAETRYEDLPASVVEHAKMRVLDLLAAGLAGFRLGLYRPLFDLLGGKEEATVWGEGVKFPLRDAALLNSFMAHSTYLDDGSRFLGGHPSSVVIPAALALAENRRSNGKELILSVVLGYDIVIRLGKAIYPSTTVRGFQSTAVLGSLGSAAASAKLLRLNPECCRNALSISSSLGVGLKEALKTPESQPIQVGRSCEGGILAALFAQKGAAGCEMILENGFLKAFADQAQGREILADLGKNYLIGETYIKIHGGCRGNHAPIDVIQGLVKKHGVSPRDIRGVRLKVDSVTMAGEIHDPKDGKQAQFSIPFSIAVVLLEGNASLYQFTDEKAADPRVRSLMAKISVEVDQELDKNYPRERGAHGEILLVDGSKLSGSIAIARGEPESPLSAGEVEEKFALLTRDILGEKVKEVLERVRVLEKLKDISDLVQRLKWKNSESESVSESKSKRG